MNAKYLLPCSCGRKIAVQLRQAGETVVCECGASIEVPIMSGLKKLELAQDPAAPKPVQPHWSLGHALIFVGGLVIVIALPIGISLYRSQPSDPYAGFTPEQMMQAAQTRTPIQSLRLWQMLEKSGLEHHKRGLEIAYEEEQSKHNVLWWLWALIPASGLGLVTAGFIALYFKGRKTRATARR